MYVFQVDTPVDEGDGAEVMKAAAHDRHTGPPRGVLRRTSLTATWRAIHTLRQLRQLESAHPILISPSQYSNLGRQSSRTSMLVVVLCDVMCLCARFRCSDARVKC